MGDERERERMIQKERGGRGKGREEGKRELVFALYLPFGVDVECNCT